jgi:hypothetical protein
MAGDHRPYEANNGRLICRARRKAYVWPTRNVGSGNVSSNATLPFVAVPASTDPDDVHPTHFGLKLLPPNAASEPYRHLLAEHGLVGSMGRRGNPYGNAKAESFKKTLRSRPSI